MATDTVQAGSAPANAPHESLEQREGESSQQHGDRLLAASRRGVNMAGDTADPIINRPAMDRLELGNCQLSYVDALTHAIMDTVEDAHGLVHAGGVINAENLSHFTSRAITLLCLQMDQVKLATDSVTAAVQGWPTTKGYRL